ncbi:adenine nucleotide alpha hydrolases-like protein [Choiromyces venosus 120613-1]|uniref:FAD synthase n=1 Tax=Choiromyces venosus 120613-1 TaxID=1336337 RepID=A0A3N4JM01_9PEZI|nr:adenine nucleotide alpha hydrolases-like protein [Choiromyces venosus 120613-1]
MENSTSSSGISTTTTATTTNSTSPPLQKIDAGQNSQASDVAPAPSEGPEEDLYTTCTRLSLQVQSFLETDHSSELLKGVQHQTRISLDVIEEALRRYKLENLSISFNGGKDCLVLLILFLASLPPHLPPSAEQKGRKINSVYVTTTYPFPQVDDFVQTCIATYHLSLTRYSQPMKPSFERYLQENPNVQAIFVGTRRTDPHGEFLTHFDVTDHGWPKFMRVHPVVDWGYREVWGFLRELHIPYCILYDMGYTSLGGTKDTHPNPALLEDGTEVQECPDGERKRKFRPAYELVEDDQERLGRDR